MTMFQSTKLGSRSFLDHDDGDVGDGDDFEVLLKILIFMMRLIWITILTRVMIICYLFFTIEMFSSQLKCSEREADKP